MYNYRLLLRRWYKPVISVDKRLFELYSCADKRSFELFGPIWALVGSQYNRVQILSLPHLKDKQLL